MAGRSRNDGIKGGMRWHVNPAFEEEYESGIAGCEDGNCESEEAPPRALVAGAHSCPRHQGLGRCIAKVKTRERRSVLV